MIFSSGNDMPSAESIRCGIAWYGLALDMLGAELKSKGTALMSKAEELHSAETYSINY